MPDENAPIYMTDEELISCQQPNQQLTRLRDLMHRLRAPGGCPWDAEQSHESLRSNLLEEAYEVIAAINAQDDENLKEELGDLLLQVVFHSEIAQETDRFDLNAVAHGVCEKLIRRHPHVFGDGDIMTDSGSVLTQWDQIKAAEKGHSADQKHPFLHKTGEGLPALQRSVKLQKKAAKVGFDWPDTNGLIEKIEEELQEVREELPPPGSTEPSPELAAEIGDLLFVTVNLARKLKLDPELLLSATNDKFYRRFSFLEERLGADGISLEDATLSQMDRYWDESKKTNP